MAESDAEVWAGPESLRTLLVALDGVRPDPKNARKHDATNIAAVQGSLRTFGQQKPIVVSPDGVILAGNATSVAARALGWTHIAAVQFDKPEVSAQRAYALADNRSAELAEWDLPVLSDTVRELSADAFDLGTLGWTDDELQVLLRSTWTAPEIAPMPGITSGTHHGGVSLSLSTEVAEQLEQACIHAREQLDDEHASTLACLAHILEGYLAHVR
jgi:hypothetical protein